jgi:FG-GAP-like repeat
MRCVAKTLPITVVITALWIGLGLIWLPITVSRGGSRVERGIVFRDIAKAAGIRFIHDNAATPEKYLIETMGAGCGWIDYDADGLLDLYLVNGAATSLYKPKARLRGALYHNNGDGTFTDVTEKAGVGSEGLFGI